MSENKIHTAIGLMSGTSLDGIDAALIRTDGEGHIERLDFRSFPYDEELRALIRACFGKRESDAAIEKAEALITQAHIEAVRDFGYGADVIGFHGQTVTHDPDAGFTWQIGDSQALADATGINVVADMRQADMEAGGQGAPLLPLYHAALAADLPKPLAVLNIGGVANVTWIGPGGITDILAFDTGPGNALMDDCILRRKGLLYDKDGMLARSGTGNENLLEQWLSHSYFMQEPPKSLDRNMWDFTASEGLNDEDALATLMIFTAKAVIAAQTHMPQIPKAWYVTGGGRKNKSLMEYLQTHLPKTLPVEDTGWNGDATEAEGFAYLAVRSLRDLPLTLPGTTGVTEPVAGGRLYRCSVPSENNKG